MSNTNNSDVAAVLVAVDLVVGMTFIGETHHPSGSNKSLHNAP